jgi:hypothetical protein
VDSEAQTKTASTLGRASHFVDYSFNIMIVMLFLIEKEHKNAYNR